MIGENAMESIKTQETPHGHRVEILLKLMRHGERGKDHRLTDEGRDTTKERARTSGAVSDDFDAVKAIGSNAGKDSSLTGMGRSLETAHIYAHEIAGDEAFVSRMNERLNYETILSPPPYDHKAFSEKMLPKNFEELSASEKALAMKETQTAIVDYVFSLETSEAEQYKKEIAGSYATVISHYKRMAGRLKDDSKVLIPAGTHGPMIEFLLQYALVRKNDDGTETIGFNKISDIGGQFNPSDSVNIEVETDAEGNIKPFRVSFDDKARPQGEMYLDPAKLKELADFYEALHAENSIKE